MSQDQSTLTSFPPPSLLYIFPSPTLSSATLNLLLPLSHLQHKTKPMPPSPFATTTYIISVINSTDHHLLPPPSSPPFTIPSNSIKTHLHLHQSVSYSFDNIRLLRQSLTSSASSPSRATQPRLLINAQVSPELHRRRIPASSPSSSLPPSAKAPSSRDPEP